MSNISVTPEQLFTTTAQLDRLQSANVQVTLARFQELKRHIDAMSAGVPGIHEYATTYIQTMQRRYLAHIAQYQENLIQGLRDVARDYTDLHQETIQDLGDITSA